MIKKKLSFGHLIIPNDTLFFIMFLLKGIYIEFDKHHKHGINH